jgi:hypothetical protein
VADAGPIKQTAAIIHSEVVFIATSPFGKAVASEQTQQTSLMFESGRGALRMSERRFDLRKVGVERLLKRARIVLNRAIETQRPAELAI